MDTGFGVIFRSQCFILLGVWESAPEAAQDTFFPLDLTA